LLFSVAFIVLLIIGHKMLQGIFVEGVKEEVVLSPAHALSLIAAGEGSLWNIPFVLELRAILLISFGGFSLFLCLKASSNEFR